ncbi:MAG: asparagine synthase (glutamine-hydrolyzing) [Eubacteriales bacterium]|nr:asparagine synthase (glutamine-hydrolyzing) [Eubacteriales bacterium]
MCGICGFTDKIEDREAVLDRMMERITHRGPDSSGKYLTDEVAMGFRRLSIIDLADGSQPMHNEDGTLTITFNGEIYNYRELRERLLQSGHVFSTRSDTEVLLHLYEEKGEDMLTDLRGMFAFAIWDEKTSTLFAARDYFGIKPFYYRHDGRNFAWASEIKSLLADPAVVKEFNPAALENYLSFQYSALPETFFRGVFRLLPAHCLTYHDGELSVRRWWQPRFETREMTLDEAVDRIDEVMLDSIRAHMVSDVEVGSFLSSGVDSSYVASCFHGDKTFTVGFDYDKYNEIGYASELSSYVGIRNFNKVITTEEFWNVLPTVQYQMDEPLADAAAVALYFVSQLASQHVKVVLSGEGADELFGGYNIYQEPLSLHGYTRLPRFLRKALAAVVRAVPFSFKGKNFIIRGSKTVEERFIGNMNIFSVAERDKLLRAGSHGLTPQQITAPYYALAKDWDDITKMQFVDIHTWLAGDILLKADRMSMAHSLELRVPFMDKEVFKVASSLKTEFRTNKTSTKYAMRLAARRHIPEEVSRRRKLGFPVPVRIWLRDEKYYNIVKAAFEREPMRELFNTDYLLKLLSDHYKGKRDNSRKIWNVYMFTVWYQQYFG